MEQSLGRNHTDSKYFNRALILRLILSQGPTSRLLLARLTGLSPAALTVLTGALIEEGLLIELEDGREEDIPKVGRRSVPLDLNTRTGLALGIHITPRMLRVGLVNLKGEIVDQERLGPPGENPAEALDLIVTSARRLITRNDLRVIGVGVGAVGLVERERGINRRALSLHWQDVPIKAELETVLALPVQVDNNVRGMTLAELLFGHGRTHNFKNIGLVYIGTGVGGGIVIDGELYWGSGASAGEIGHMIIDANGPPCYCGAQGCVEQFAGEAALLIAAQQAARDPQSLLFEMAEGDPAQVTIEHLIEAARRNDSASIEILERAGRAIGMAVANIYRVLNPDTVIIAGRISRAPAFFMEAVRAEAGRSKIALGSELTVLSSSLGDNIGLVGAAALALREFLFTPRPLRNTEFRPASSLNALKIGD